MVTPEEPVPGPTKAMKRALAFVREQGGEVIDWPVGVATPAVRDRCANAGWLTKDRPLPGSKLVRWRLTPAGIAAL